MQPQAMLHQLVTQFHPLNDAVFSAFYDIWESVTFEKKTILLNKPSMGLLIPTGIWRELQNFSSGAVCLVLASDVFEESDYIRDYPQFLETKK